MKRSSCMVIGILLVIFAAMPVSIMAAEEVTLTGVFQGTSYNTHFHPIAGKIVSDEGSEYMVVDNDVAHELYHITEGNKVMVTGRISDGPDGKQIELKAFTPLQ